MNYSFFDYKYNIENFSSDLFSIPHIIFIILAFIAVPTVSILLRKVNHKRIEKFLKIFSICILVLEITKIIWESYWDISTGRGFNKGGILPLYTCSLFIYTMLFAAWGKGKAKDYSLAFITTISLISGAIGVVQCNGLNYYPFWTFGAFYSMFFHLSMFATGVFLLFTGYRKLQWIDMIKAWIPMAILSIIASPVNYEYGADYMQIYEGSGIPLFSTLADILAAADVRFIFTIIMLVTYIPLSAVIIAPLKLIEHIKIKRVNKNDKSIEDESAITKK